MIFGEFEWLELAKNSCDVHLEALVHCMESGLMFGSLITLRDTNHVFSSLIFAFQKWWHLTVQHGLKFTRPSPTVDIWNSSWSRIKSLENMCSTQLYVPSLSKQQIFLQMNMLPAVLISGFQDSSVQTSPCSFVWRRFWRCLCQPLFFGALYVLRHGVPGLRQGHWLLNVFRIWSKGVCI